MKIRNPRAILSRFKESVEWCTSSEFQQFKRHMRKHQELREKELEAEDVDPNVRYPEIHSVQDSRYREDTGKARSSLE